LWEQAKSVKVCPAPPEMGTSGDGQGLGERVTWRRRHLWRWAVGAGTSGDGAAVEVSRAVETTPGLGERHLRRWCRRALGYSGAGVTGRLRQEAPPEMVRRRVWSCRRRGCCGEWPGPEPGEARVRGETGFSAPSLRRGRSKWRAGGGRRDVEACGACGACLLGASSSSVAPGTSGDGSATRLGRWRPRGLVERPRWAWQAPPEMGSGAASASRPVRVVQCPRRVVVGVARGRRDVEACGSSSCTGLGGAMSQRRTGGSCGTVRRASVEAAGAPPESGRAGGT
jgi:hypothetical protein